LIVIERLEITPDKTDYQPMKTSSQLIYFGLFIILLGFGDNSGKLIPSWIAFLVGYKRSNAYYEN